MTQAGFVGWHLNVMHHNSQFAHFSPSSIYAILTSSHLMRPATFPSFPFRFSFSLPIPFSEINRAAKHDSTMHISLHPPPITEPKWHTPRNKLAPWLVVTLQGQIRFRHVSLPNRGWDRETHLDNVEKGHIALIQNALIAVTPTKTVQPGLQAQHTHTRFPSAC